jgi:hypothetical protein
LDGVRPLIPANASRKRLRRDGGGLVRKNEYALARGIRAGRFTPTLQQGCVSGPSGV